MRKTKKYYRDQINKSYLSAYIVLEETIIKYGEKYGRGNRRVKFPHVSNKHNGSIEGFYYFKNKLYVDIYWQGDSTDGNDSVEFKPSGVVLPTKTWFDGARTVTDHSDVEFDKDELYQAIVNFAQAYLK